jgi:uncharacterized protein (TIGR00251 family)
MPSPTAAFPWLVETTDGRLLLHIAAQPNAKKTAVVGLRGGAVKLKVASPPVDGAANAEIVAFIATTLGLKQKDVTIVRGETGRRKTVELPAGTNLQNLADLLRKCS